MDCSEALELLDCVRPNTDDLLLFELAEARAHLEGCAQCQCEFAKRQQFDHEVLAAMSQVPVPTDLLARLQSKLQAAAEAGQTTNTGLDELAAVQTRIAVAQRRRSRRLISAVCITACLLLVGLVFWQRSPTPVSVLDVLRVVTLDHTQTEPFDTAFQTRTPVGWSGDIVRYLGDWRGQDIDDRHGHDIATRLFEVRTRRGHSVTGLLVMLPEHRVSPAPAAGRFSMAVPQYVTRDGVQLVAGAWQEGGDVYLCLIPEDIRDFELLQRMLKGTSA